MSVDASASSQRALKGFEPKRFFKKAVKKVKKSLQRLSIEGQMPCVILPA
jgi:hypothetical protein